MIKNLSKDSSRKLVMNSIAFLVFFLFFVITLLVSEGFAYDQATVTVSTGKISSICITCFRCRLVLIFFLAGVVGVLYGIGSTLFKGSRKGIWYTGIGTVLAVFALLLTAGFNGTAFLPVNLRSEQLADNRQSLFKPVYP